MRETKGQNSKGHTGFLIVLSEIIIESIVRTIWTVVEAMTQSNNDDDEDGGESHFCNDNKIGQICQLLGRSRGKS